MRRWGNWNYDGVFAETGAMLVHRKAGATVPLAQVRSMAEIPQAMEVAYHMCAIGPMDLIHLAAALIEIVGERKA
jgi:hypothetical protein